MSGAAAGASLGRLFRSVVLPGGGAQTRAGMARRIGTDVLKASLTSGVIMAAGDVIRQRMVPGTAGLEAGKPKRRGNDEDGAYDRFRLSMLSRHGVDTDSALRFGATGALFHGPWFLYGFRTLDALVPASSLRAALLKSAIGQVTLFPVYLSVFFYAIGTCGRRARPLPPRTVVESA